MNNSPTIRLTRRALAVASSLVLVSTPLASQTSWECVSLADQEVTGILYDSSNGAVIAGADNGIHRSTDGGLTFSQMQTIYCSTNSWKIASDGHGNVYAGNANEVFARSTDKGVSWDVDRGIMDQFRFINAIGVDDIGRVYVANTTTVYRSDDSGSTWLAHNNGLPGNYPDVNTFGQNIGGSFFAITGGIAGPHIYRTTNHGDSWSLVREGTSGHDVFHWASTPSGVALSYSYAQGVLRTTDDGLTWTVVEIPIEHSSVNCLAVGGGRVYAAALPTRVFASSDDGLTWSALPVDGLPSVGIRRLAFVPGALLAATEVGVYRLVLGTTGVEDEEPARRSVRAWPLPASDWLNVSCAMGESATVELVDHLGRIRATASARSARFDVSNLPAGAYIVRWRTDEGTTLTRAIVAR